MSDDLATLASEAYIYGFALVFDLQQVGRFTREGMESLAPAPARMSLEPHGRPAPLQGIAVPAAVINGWGSPSTCSTTTWPISARAPSMTPCGR